MDETSKSPRPVRVEDSSELDFHAEKQTLRKPGPLPENYKPLGNVSRAWIENVQGHLKKVCAETSPDAFYLKVNVEPPFMPFMGASPDGVASCSCHGKKLVEIKCSYKHRGIPVKDIPTQDPSYHLETVHGQLQLKKSSGWYSQIQYQLGVTRMNQCDLVVYTLKGITSIPVMFVGTLEKERRACVHSCFYMQ
ncbi:uncharacterized protein LOC110984252 [Acanthaster planci]|uniref:Uncharacterized protein LOC110984252 n=1 Tax=Acanthaster planci TaxID=133434 RepID=A0A8B7Z2U1_ACAPL|nr:uncharacterized protein LOC110984252 [Acanthaster planci]